jgi:SAM-dependent methyltransferase
MTIEFRQRPETYLGEVRYTKPKRVFSMLAQLMEESGLAKGGARFLDVGCATGELIYFLRERFPALAFAGVDNQPEFIATARRQEELRDVTFAEADALAYSGEPSDFVACFGMLGIFDSFEPLLESLLRNTRKGGRVYLHALLNDVDIDVRVYYRDNQNKKDWNRGFNIFSMDQVAKWLEPRVASWRVMPVELDVDIARRPELPHRAYTQKLEGGRRVTTNGLCLVLPEKILEITA